MPQLDDKQIASMMATQTATLAVILELLIKDGTLDHGDLLRELRSLFTMGMNASAQGLGPLDHLITLLENTKPQSH